MTIDAAAAGGKTRTETLPAFELTAIGVKQGGATPAEVGRIVLVAVARDVAVAVAADRAREGRRQTARRSARRRHQEGRRRRHRRRPRRRARHAPGRQEAPAPRIRDPAGARRGGYGQAAVAKTISRAVSRLAGVVRASPRAPFVHPWAGDEVRAVVAEREDAVVALVQADVRRARRVAGDDVLEARVFSGTTMRTFTGAPTTTTRCRQRLPKPRLPR